MVLSSRHDPGQEEPWSLQTSYWHMVPARASRLLLIVAVTMMMYEL